MSMPEKRDMVEAVKRLATKTQNPQMAADLQAIMTGVNIVLMEHEMADLQLQLVKAKK